MKRTMPRHDVVQPLDPSYRIIPLTKGQNALVSTCDYEYISQFNWCAMFLRKRNCYVATRNTYIDGLILMHCEILKTDKDVDHINLNPLDNRRENLRIATRSQNLANKPKLSNNTTGYKGCYYNPSHYHSSIGINGKQKYLGIFPDTEEGKIAAARAYDRAAIAAFGEFACLNFPRSTYP